ncbi:MULTISPECIES: SDR family oxidoreductase [Mesonia]|uniref:Oxidoreductase n=1 Tax=Mesonia oceanica TaxID=2687242 RepID=A0AC61YDR8_9FLAO|nr:MULTISPECIES: SDR family oxidoreductase [Mesonia]MAN29310.1 oxidoreductase [Mesonia sp.]MAQ40930.1 oxidoreductase [Mesonia sp.]MBJ98393.1 oxidoreductase [Flavobacteriaceae bacterium]VVV02293.1 putative oxidoreductase [Mesonia oceanica]|tara:strand:+ start:19257 stop:19994 length:738 start_codon:yes stop_codon:yes gene_type:complete
MQNIKEKVVVITGASSGIGKSIALNLAAKGAKVVLAARREEKLKKIVENIIQDGGEASYVVADVQHRTDLAKLVSIALAEFGKLDVMINNAGISQLSKIDELDVEGWEQMINVNLNGTLYGMAAAIPVFKKQKSGHIVNIISTAGLTITPTMGVYAGTKNAVRTISEAFRQESDGSIRITGISPGFVDTDFAENIKNDQMRTAILKSRDEIAISAEAIADAVIYAISQPKEVEIGDIVIRPAVQN